MLSTLIRLKVLPEKQAEFEGLVAQLVQDVYENEPAPRLYEVRRCKDDPLSYVYLFSFKDEAAQQRFQDADYHTQMAPKAVACLDGDPVYEQLESFY